jgi:O-antigen/teichoic acid export membrane protein
LLYLAGALLQGLGIFLVQPFALHLLQSDAKWQELFLSVSIIQVGVVLAAAGLPLAITKAWFDAGGPAKARAISGFMTLGGLVLGVLAAGICQFASGGGGASTSFSIALLAMGLQAGVLAAQAILRAQGRAVMFVVLSLISSMAAYIAGLTAMLLYGAEANIFMTGYGLMVLVSALVAAWTTKPSWPLSYQGAVREGIAIGLPVLPHTGALMLLTQGAVFLLAVTAAEGVSGDYGKVQVFVLGTITLLGALNNAWVPALMAVKGAERVARLRSTMRTASLAGLGIVVVASAGANLVTHIMAGGKESLIPVAQVMPLVAMGYLLYLNASTLLFADNTTWWLSVVTPLVLVVGAALALVPALEGNLVGMAVTSVLTFMVLGVAYFVIVRRRAAGGWALKIYGACTFAAAAYVVVLTLLPRNIFTGVLTVAVVATALAGGGLTWRLLSRRRPRPVGTKKGDGTKDSHRSVVK